MDEKQSSIEFGTQVASSPIACIVDAVSSVGVREQCTEALELTGQQENAERRDQVISLENTVLVANPTLNCLIKDNFLCPICQSLLVRARILGCGHQFCRECLHQWLKSRRICPLCRQPAATCVASLAIDSFLDDVVERSECEELKRQRQLRKAEQDSARLDQKGGSQIPTETTSVMISNYSQTISSYSQGTPGNLANVTAESWIQSDINNSATEN